MAETYTATFGSTTERELRAAMLRNDTIVLTPPDNTDTGTIGCTAFVGNNQWLRLTFSGTEYTYYFDNTKGWYYVTNNMSEDDISQRIAELSVALSAKEDKPETVVIIEAGSLTQAIDPDKEYYFSGAVTGLTLELNETDDQTYDQLHYHIAFASPADADMQLTITPTVIMPDDFAIARGRYYEMDILRKYVAVNSWGMSQNA